MEQEGAARLTNERQRHYLRWACSHPKAKQLQIGAMFINHTKEKLGIKGEKKIPNRMQNRTFENGLYKAFR